MAKAKQQLPPLEYRPVFVSYVARRKCRFNPSADRALSLPTTYREQLIDRWQARHKGVAFPAWDVSRRPIRQRKAE